MRNKYYLIIILISIIIININAQEINYTFDKWDEQTIQLWKKYIEEWHGMNTEEWGENPYISEYAIRKLGFPFCDYIYRTRYYKSEIGPKIENASISIIDEYTDIMNYINNSTYDDLKKYIENHEIFEREIILEANIIYYNLHKLFITDNNSQNTYLLEKIENILEVYKRDEYIIKQTYYLIKYYNDIYNSLYEIYEYKEDVLILILEKELGEKWYYYFFSWI